MTCKAAVILLGALSFTVHATEVFKWVDEKGKVHYGSSVPEKYSNKGRKLQSDSPDVLEARRREAEERAEREKAAADALNKRQNTPPPPIVAAPKPKPPAGDASCAEKWNEYKASIDCFAPFVRGNGTVREEAFAVCPTVKQPVNCPTPVGSSDR